MQTSYLNLNPSQPQSIRPSSKDSCLSVFKAGGGDRAERREKEMQTHRLGDFSLVA